MTHYKPYSVEWTRQRYLREALYTYIEDGINNDIILQEICDILYERSEQSYQDFATCNDLAERFN
jgi:hypothetical protein